MSIYFLLQFKIGPYNYKRANLWVSIQIIAVIMTAFISILNEMMDTNFIVWVSILIVIYVLLGIVGLIIMIKKCPSMFYKEKANKISDLFKFELTPGATPDEHNINSP
mmetsp:Transcript_36379/g.6506  ORF Transcript_36379/g.6506 Transcript_36379/m.6506 type:complete len:108 (+) Transcript_36379:751-1074(+)